MKLFQAQTTNYEADPELRSFFDGKFYEMEGIQVVHDDGSALSSAFTSGIAGISQEDFFSHD